MQGGTYVFDGASDTSIMIKTVEVVEGYHVTVEISYTLMDKQPRLSTPQFKRIDHVWGAN